MNSRSFWDSWEGKATLYLVIIAICADIASIPIGLAWGEEGYLGKLNWSLYPLFFALCGILVYASWEYYIRAWYGLILNGVIYKDNQPVDDVSAIEAFITSLIQRRKTIVFISVLFGFLITVLDMRCLWAEYGLIDSEKCKERDFSVAFAIPSVFPNATFATTVAFNLIAYSMQAALIALGFISLAQISIHGYLFFRFEHFPSIRKEGLSIKLN